MEGQGGRRGESRATPTPKYHYSDKVCNVTVTAPIRLCLRVTRHVTVNSDKPCHCPKVCPPHLLEFGDKGLVLLPMV